MLKNVSVIFYIADQSILNEHNALRITKKVINFDD